MPFDALKKAMETHGHTKETVSKLLDVSEEAVRCWLAGDYKPTPDNIHILRALYPELEWEDFYPAPKKNKASNG